MNLLKSPSRNLPPHDDDENIQYIWKCSEGKRSEGHSHELMREDIIARVIFIEGDIL
jgi:hypothetical protein